MPDLTTLIAAKQYLAITSTNVDQLITRLIPRESRLIEKWTSRRFPFVQHTNKPLDGTGTGMLMLPDTPIIGIDALTIDGTAVVAANTPQGPGYQFDNSVIYLTGGRRFPLGRQNVLVSWRAGYQANVPLTVPAPEGNASTSSVWIDDPGSPVTVNAITDGNGAAFTLSTDANGPLVGQYQFNAPNIVFNGGDAGAALTINIDFVPEPIEQACIEMIGLDLKQRDNLGIRSKSLANETISYEGGGLSQSVKEMLQPYRKVVPV